MRRVLLPVLAAVVAIVACRDVTQQNSKKTDTAPAAPSADASAAAPQAYASTVCAAYRHQLGEARAALARTPADESLRQNVDTYQAIIADACS